MKKILLGFFTLSSLSTLVVAAPSPCSDVRSCAGVVSKLTGQKYVLNGGVDKKVVNFVGDVQLTKDNADLFFTNILHQYGLTRVPVSAAEKNTYYIVESKEALQQPIPVFEASHEMAPSLPNTYDSVTVKYTMISREVANELQRFIIDLIPRSGRITNYPGTSLLVITDSAMNMRKILDVVKSVDRPLGADARKELERVRANREARKDN